jgi:TonB family protein
MRRSRWLVGIFGVFVAVSAAQIAEPPQKLPVVKSGEMPFYPPLPRMAHVEGDVQLRVTTDGSGVASVVVESGQPMLAKAAQDNVRTWKFEPHNPTSFSTVFSYHLLTEFKCEPGKPNNGEFHIKLPTEVEITASTTLRDSYCDPTQGLDLSEPLRVFLTSCEVDGSTVPCEGLTISLHLGSLTVTPTRFKESEKKQGFVVPKEFRTLKEFTVTVDTANGSFTTGNQDISFLKGKWHVGIDHAPFKEETPIYNAPATLRCAGFIHFEWSEPERITSAPCK